jgi:hypothetical protein
MTRTGASCATPSPPSTLCAACLAAASPPVRSTTSSASASAPTCAWFGPTAEDFASHAIADARRSSRASRGLVDDPRGEVILLPMGARPTRGGNERCGREKNARGSQAIGPPCPGAVGATFELPARSARAPSRRRFGRCVAEKSRPSGPLVSRSPQGRPKCKASSIYGLFPHLG